MIHPTAILEPGIQLGPGCEIHPYAIVKRGAVLGEGVIVHSFAVVGGDSQDLKFDPAVSSGVRIGAATRIRENVTINRANGAGTFTEIGADCLLQAGCHVGHDCVVGRRVVIGSAALLAGHVCVGDNAVLGSGTGFHQFIRVGEGSEVAPGVILTVDLPPFLLADGRNEVAGLNLAGLAGAAGSAIQELEEAFRRVYSAGGSLVAAAAAALASGDCAAPQARRFLEFFADGQRGYARPRRAR